MHVFSDLKPYLCTFSDCKSSHLTFPSRQLWADHEFQNHRSLKIYRCSVCQLDHATGKSFLDHLEQNHSSKRPQNEVQASTLLTVAKTDVLADLSTEACPLCQKIGFISHRDFVSHVGRHMEDLALIALPRDNEADSDSDGSLEQPPAGPRGFSQESVAEVQESVVEIGSAPSPYPASLKPGHVGLSEANIITTEETDSIDPRQFELGDIVVRIPSGYHTFGAKCDSAAQINIIAENVSHRFISSMDLLCSDQDIPPGLFKRACPNIGRFNLTFYINRKDGARIGPYKAWFYVVQDQYIEDAFDTLLSEKLVKKLGLLVEPLGNHDSALNSPRLAWDVGEL